MAIGRTIYGYYGDRFPLRSCLAGSSILCIVTYLVTIFFPNPFISLLSCSLTGLSVSLMWPGTFSLTSAAFPRGGTMMFGILAICGDIGCSAGPWLAGKLSDSVSRGKLSPSLWSGRGLDPEQTGLRTGLLAAVLFPLLMFIVLLLFHRKKADKDMS